MCGEPHQACDSDQRRRSRQRQRPALSFSRPLWEGSRCLRVPCVRSVPQASPIYRRNEAVSAARQCFDKPRVVGIVAQGLAQLVDRLVKPCSKLTNVSAGQSLSCRSSLVTTSPGRSRRKASASKGAPQSSPSSFVEPIP